MLSRAATLGRTGSSGRRGRLRAAAAAGSPRSRACAPARPPPAGFARRVSRVSRRTFFLFSSRRACFFPERERDRSRVFSREYFCVFRVSKPSFAHGSRPRSCPATRAPRPAFSEFLFIHFKTCFPGIPRESGGIVASSPRDADATFCRKRHEARFLSTSSRSTIRPRGFRVERTQQGGRCFSSP